MNSGVLLHFSNNTVCETWKYEMFVLNSKGSFVMLMRVLDETFFS